MAGRNLKNIAKLILLFFGATIIAGAYQNCADQKLSSAFSSEIQAASRVGINGNPPEIKCSPDLPSPRFENYTETENLSSTCQYGGNKQKINYKKRTLSCTDGQWLQTSDETISSETTGTCNPQPQQNCGNVAAGTVLPAAYYGNNINQTEACAPDTSLSHQVTYQKLEVYFCDGTTGTLKPSQEPFQVGSKITEEPCNCRVDSEIKNHGTTWAKGYDYEKSVIKKLYRCENSQVYELQSDCTALTNFNNTNQSANAALQTCINNAPYFMTLRLPPGVYGLTTNITINKQINITTIGRDFNSAPCGYSDERCATLKMLRTDKIIQQGFVKACAPDVSFNSIIFDGNKEARYESNADLGCRGGLTTQVREPDPVCGYITENLPLNGNQNGYSLVMYNQNNHIIQNSVFKNTLCGTSFAYVGSQLTFKQNTVADAGRHNVRFAWADGITLLVSPNSFISENIFVDNTDVQLIFGSCPNCEVKDNIIRHTGRFSSSSFAALIAHSWPGGTDGDYRNSYFHHNKIDCHISKRCGIGFGIGANGWYMGPTFGGEYSLNSIKNAMVGININDAAVPFNQNSGVDLTPYKVKFRSNSVLDSNGPYVGSNQCLNGCPSSNYNISNASLNLVDADFISYSTRYDYTNSIPNYDGAGSDNDLSPFRNYADNIPFKYANEYVRNLYLNFLEREPDEQGHLYWMRQCRLDLKNTTLALALSQEAFNTPSQPGKTFDKRKFATALYKGILNRAANQISESEIQGAMSTDDQTLNTRTAIINSFLNSQEFKDRFKNFECQ